ncbi:MAG: PEGA domain-containing protein [Patescibacteria group bacterium]
MAVSTIRNDNKSFSTALIYFLGILGVALVVFFGGEVIKYLGGFGGKAGLTVEVVNGEATVLVNNKEVGKTPFESKSIKSGTNTVTVKSSSQQYQTTIKFLPSKKGQAFGVGIVRDLGVSDVFSSGQEFWFDKDNPNDTLRIVSDPSGAAVSIDGTEIGKTPFSSSSIAAGDYELKISLSGYETQTARVNIQKGYTLNGSIKLFPYPVSSNVKAFEGSAGLYDASSDNTALTSDTPSWVKGILYWNKTRGINIDDVGLNKENVFDYFIDYSGNIYNSEGTLVQTKEDFDNLKDIKKGVYLGRLSDGAGLTKEAKDALNTLSALGISSKTAKVLDTPTGWLRVRSDSSLNGTEISRVTSGNSYTVIEEKTDWVKIKVSDTVEGWVSSAYVSLSQ